MLDDPFETDPGFTPERLLEIAAFNRRVAAHQAEMEEAGEISDEEYLMGLGRREEQED